MAAALRDHRVIDRGDAVQDTLEIDIDAAVQADAAAAWSA